MAITQEREFAWLKPQILDRYFDAVITITRCATFAAGLAIEGKPIAAIYSTFLQRAL